MKTKKEINEILSLRREKYSIRQIAKRLKMSKTTVHTYLKLASSVKEAQPALKIETTDGTVSSGNVSTNNKDIDWSKLFRDEPLGSTKIGGMPSSEFSNNYNPVQDHYYNHDDRPPRRRGISFDPYMESNDYLNYDDYYGRQRMPGIPIPQREHRAPEKSTQQIIQELKEQKEKQKIQSLSKKLDRLDKLAGEKRELEKKSNLIGEQKLAFDQNKKTGLDNLNKITAPNQNNKIGSIPHVEEPQKTEKLEGQNKLTNHEGTHTDKNSLIHDSNNPKSAVFDTNTVLLLAASAFEGFFTGIDSGSGQEVYKAKHNKNTPKQVKLIPHQEVKLTPIDN